MSKKNKQNQKNTSVKSLSQKQIISENIENPPFVAESVSPITTERIEDRPFELIRVDRKLQIFLGLCLGLFLLLSLAGIHGSSVGFWNEALEDNNTSSNTGILLGKPKSVRYDDYCVQTPYILSQINKGFPVQNMCIGGEKAPLISFLPTKHFTTAFRPNFWGYFFLSAEQGFAWAWNFKTFGLLIAVTLMFLLLTQNNFWLSIFGSVWLLYSSGTQWWYSSSLPDMILAGSVLFVCGVYLIFSKKTVTIFLASTLFVMFGVYYALLLYPPYQIPFTYFILLIFAGYVIEYYKKGDIFTAIPYKIVAISIAFIGLGIILYLFYQDAKPTIDIMNNTVYPGKRIDSGGKGFVANWFSEYYHFFVGEGNIPTSWVHICELSHYLTFSPIIIACLIIYYRITKNKNYVLVFTSIYIVFMLVWIFFGFPEFLAKATLMTMSPTKRTQIPFGIANVVLAVVYLSQIGKMQIKVSSDYLIACLAGVFVFIFASAYFNNANTGSFFKMYQLVIPFLLFGFANALLIFLLKIKYREIIFCGIIGIYLIPNLLINPVSRGLTSITDKEIYKKIVEIKATDPQSKWIMMGKSTQLGLFITSTGIDVLGGNKYVPDFKTLSYLDDGNKQANVYNRYAHTEFTPILSTEMGENASFELPFDDMYLVSLDPCSPRLKKMGVNYVVFATQPDSSTVRCMTKVYDGYQKIYKIN